MDDGGGEGLAGQSGQWVRSRTDRDANLHMEEQQAQRGARLRPMSARERRLFWAGSALVVAIAVAQRIFGG